MLPCSTTGLERARRKPSIPRSPTEISLASIVPRALRRYVEKAAGSWLCVESAAEARMPLADAPGRGEQLEEDPRFVGETAPVETTYELEHAHIETL